jgi:hypothetical protein
MILAFGQNQKRDERRVRFHVANVPGTRGCRLGDVTQLPTPTYNRAPLTQEIFSTNNFINLLKKEILLNK